MNISTDTKNFVEHVIDLGAIGWGVAAFLDFLPHIAALLSVVWLVLRVQNMWLANKLKKMQIKHFHSRKTDIEEET